MGLGVYDVKSLILVDSLFLLDGGRRREGKNKEKKKKKNYLGRGGFPWVWSYLTSFAAVRCN
jgi:hypothetical protein